MMGMSGMEDCLDKWMEERHGAHSTTDNATSTFRYHALGIQIADAACGEVGCISTSFFSLPDNVEGRGCKITSGVDKGMGVLL